MVLYSGPLPHVMWQPGWEGVWGRMDARLCMTASLCCPLEIITTLLIGYTPIQNKEFNLKMPFKKKS